MSTSYCGANSRLRRASVLVGQVPTRSPAASLDIGKVGYGRPIGVGAIRKDPGVECYTAAASVRTRTRNAAAAWGSVSTSARTAM